MVIPAARAGTTTTVPNPLTQTSPLATPKAISTKEQVLDVFLHFPKVANWLERYPPSPTTDATYKDGTWTVNVWSGRAGEIATGTVDDGTTAVAEAWTGPQVAWRMARGSPGAFGGTKINSYTVWLSLSGLFLLGLFDWRRPLSVRNADLLVLLSFSVSLWFFNHGHVFAAMSLAYPPLAWILVRCIWIARADKPTRGIGVWPVWVLAAATVFLAGFRIGLNTRSSNVIDVGYSGIIGADRIVHGQSPYGHFPVEDAAAEVRAGRLERRGARPHPDERALRDGEPARRYLRTGVVPGLHPRLRWSSAGATSGTACRRFT